MSGTLFVVATPIGNLDDLTPRARQTLATVDLIAAEDTRHTQRLLSNIGSKPALLALHDHNEERAVHGLIEALEEGKDVALVSDAGTPLVSDPGFRLVRAAHEHRITVVPVPGASAVTAALSVAGLPTDRFCFEGFIPLKKGRQTLLTQLSTESRTMVFYESPMRLVKTLELFMQYFGVDRPCSVSRELSKKFEENKRGSLKEVHDYFQAKGVKGEIVIVVGGKE